MEQFNPLILIVMYGLRCLVPLLVMLGLSYLFKRLGLIQEPPPPPDELPPSNHASSQGGLLHGKV